MTNGINIGMNLESVVYWATENPFIDRVHTGQGWVALDAANKNISSTVAHDADGNFTSLDGVAKIGFAVAVDPKYAAPVDEYVLTYEGTGKASIAGGKIISQTPGKVVFDYTGGDSQPGVVITFSGITLSDMIHDPHVVRVDQQTLFNQGEIFNPDFVSRVSEWGMVRFMDWGNTNASQDVSWAGRDTLQDTFWSKQAHTDGAPIEAMVKLANEAHVDMWYSVPTKADDTYVRNVMTYIRDHLDPNLKVHVEWSNEVWNTSFAANAYAKSQATALWGTSVTATHASSVYYGYRSAQIADIAHQVFTGTHAAQLSDVLAGQMANATMMADWQSGIAKAGFGAASTLFKEYAIAPYFGQQMGTAVASVDLQTILGWAKGGAAGLDAAFHEIEFGGTLSANYSLAHTEANIAKSGQIAAANHLSLSTYEAGTSLSTTRWAAADKAAVQDLFNRMMADPRMGDLYTKEINAFKAAGGGLFTDYNDVGAAGDSGTWGNLASIYSGNTPRYDAFLAAGATVTNTVPVSGSVASPSSTTSASDTPPAASGQITGSSGNDTLVASNVNDTVDGGAGDDVIKGSSGSTDTHGHFIEADIYMGGAGSDTITGGDGNDHIYGNEMTTTAGSVDGADSLSGGAGSDYIQGNAGNDTIDGGSGADRLYGGAGDDSVMGGDGNDYLQGNKGNDILSGGNGNDVLHGGGDNDMLSGDAGNDQLYGDAGNDVLIGGAGIDTLTGGAGSDTFVFSGSDAAFSTSGASAWVTDEITDFSHGSDVIQLDFHPAQLFSGTAASAADAMTLAKSLVSAHSGEADVAAVAVGNDTYLFWSSGGQGGSIDSAVKIDHVHDTFTMSDFH
ncbi:MAG: hypothetical protein JF628_07155 [Sphingomonas sp.]|nr:hypothetical protein [Sphingomonas sp.]